MEIGNPVENPDIIVMPEENPVPERNPVVVPERIPVEEPAGT